MTASNDIKQDIAELEALKASARRWKLGCTLFTTIVVVGCAAEESL